MKIRNSRFLWPVLASVFVLAVGCSDVDKIPLTGERIAILPKEQKLEQGYYGGEIILPQAQTNTEWPQAYGLANHAVGHVNLPAEVRKAWSVNIGAGSSENEKLMQSPVVANGLVFTMDSEGKISALDAKTGKRQWKYAIKEDEKAHLRASGGLAVAGNTLFVATGLGKVFALDIANGNLLWQQSVGVPVRVQPAVAEGKVFVVGHNNRLFVLNGADGQLLWTHSGIEESLALLGGSTPAVVDEKVIVPYSSGEIYIIQTDGRYLWHEALAFNVQADPLSALVDVAASPVVVDGTIYVVNSRGVMSAFNLEKGSRIWERRLASLQTPAVGGNALFVLNTDNQMVALNRATGQVVWVKDMETSLPAAKVARLWAGPVLAGDRLVAVSSDGYAVTLNPTTGNLLKAVKLSGSFSVAPIVANEMLYFLAENGQLIAFR